MHTIPVSIPPSSGHHSGPVLLAVVLGIVVLGAVYRLLAFSGQSTRQPDPACVDRLSDLCSAGADRRANLAALAAVLPDAAVAGDIHPAVRERIWPGLIQASVVAVATRLSPYGHLRHYLA